MIDKYDPLPVTGQARILGLSRSGVYYAPVSMSDADVAIMSIIDEIHTRLPFYGIRRIKGELADCGFTVGWQHVITLMRKIGIEAIHPKRRTSTPHPGHRVYP